MDSSNEQIIELKSIVAELKTQKDSEDHPLHNELQALKKKLVEKDYRIETLNQEKGTIEKRLQHEIRSLKEEVTAKLPGNKKCSSIIRSKFADLYTLGTYPLCKLVQCMLDLFSAIASSAVLKVEEELRQRVEDEIKIIRDASLREVEEGANRVLTLKAHLIEVKSQLHRQVT